MRIGFLRRTGLFILLGLTLGSAFLARGQGEGIFAEFNTSMGSFTCRLEYAYAPKAVANFIGLATGQRPWLDQNTGAVRNDKFYDGLIFHRVIKGFVIQSGSRNGSGSDGPGYAFVDEFTPSLRYGTSGVLGMANSGTNSNGAQFFITAGPQASLNDHYTIFGELTDGTNVVLDINRVGTDFNDRPTNSIVLQSVVIQRVGSDAQAFDINAQGLPLVTSQRLDIANASSNQVSLTFSNQAETENFLFSSANVYVPSLHTNVYVTTNYFTTNVVLGVTNLTQTNATVTNIILNTLYATNVYSTNLAVWGSQSLGIEVTNSPITNTVYRVKVQAPRFFRLAQIEYPPIYVPRNLYNRTLTLNFDDTGQGTIVVNFDGSGGGTYTPPPADPPGTIANYFWSQSYYQGDLDPITYSGFVLPMSLTFYFNSPSSGIFNGSVNATTPYTVTGTFTLSP
jgi:peptidyl-prolyl cis-trans isomerase A (cyclophilin A)